IYISTDYGNTWTAKDTTRNWNGVAMSSNGQYQTAVVYGGQIYVSGRDFRTNGNLEWGGDNTPQNYVRIGLVQMCWGTGSATSTSTGNVDISFSAAFYDTSYSMTVLSSGYNSYVTAYNSAKSTTQWIDLTMLDPSGNPVTGSYSWTAIGRWM
ncbi:MAG: hypothetical protein NT038_04720, partial [Euryarchaeota archaeon]|nr:hypothetical protein [Euryarchaeota archaeon]